VEFFCGKNTGVGVRSEGPKLYHFHSSNFKEELQEAYLTECWSMYLEAVKDHNKDVLIE
jgi:hypothetical protein